MLYFTIVVTLFIAAVMYAHNVYLLHQSTTAGHELREAARRVRYWFESVDHTLLITFLIGTWWGAASHTLTDWAAAVWKQTVKML